MKTFRKNIQTLLPRSILKLDIHIIIGFHPQLHTCGVRHVWDMQEFHQGIPNVIGHIILLMEEILYYRDIDIHQVMISGISYL